MTATRRLAGLLLPGVVALATLGCAPITSAALRPFYTPAQLSTSEVDVRFDVPYVEGGDPEKQALDFYFPHGSGWPTLVFVHGGSLTRGDKGLRIGRYDIYQNIGRFYAQRGVGVALVNYRLQPEATWRDQVDDVAAAIAWTARHVRELGGSGSIVVSGHSAGGWLAAHAILGVDPEKEGWLARHGSGVEAVAGVVILSGSGFDLTDRLTWELYPEEDIWSQRMKSDDPSVDWRLAASVVPLLSRIETESVPRFLLLHSKRELRALQRQNLLFFEALEHAGIDSELDPLAHGNHRRTVLAMSRAKSEVAQRVLAFIASSAKSSASLQTGP